MSEHTPHTPQPFRDHSCRTRSASTTFRGGPPSTKRWDPCPSSPPRPSAWPSRFSYRPGGPARHRLDGQAGPVLAVLPLSPGTARAPRLRHVSAHVVGGRCAQRPARTAWPGAARAHRLLPPRSASPPCAQESDTGRLRRRTRLPRACVRHAPHRPDRSGAGTTGLTAHTIAMSAPGSRPTSASRVLRLGDVLLGPARGDRADWTSSSGGVHGEAPGRLKRRRS